MAKDDFDDLDGVADQFDPSKGAKALRMSMLPDGLHQARFKSGELTKLGTQSAVKVVLEIVGDEMDGSLVEHVWWLGKPEGVNGMAADFKTLGVASDQWAKRGKLSTNIAAAVQSVVGSRLMFKFHKSTQVSSSTGKEYDNVIFFGPVPENREKMPKGPSVPRGGKPTADEGDEYF